MKKLNFFSFVLLFFSTSIFLYIFYRLLILNDGSYRNFLFYFVLNLIIFFLSLLIIKTEKIKIYIFISLISIIFSFYLFEIFSLYDAKNYYLSLTEKKKLFKNKNLKYDQRSNVEVYFEEKKLLDKVVLAFTPHNHQIEKDDFLPLSYIANYKIIVCNENGYWSHFITDRHGFNNDNNIWKKNIFNYVLIGDSFIIGHCVNKGENLASQLYKLNKKNILNLGIGGTSTLSQYAILKEYLPQNTEKILFFYFEGNDLHELEEEFENQILKKYLTEKNFKQNLINKQNLVNRAYEKNFQKNLDLYLEKKKNVEIKEAPSIHQYFFNLIKLTNTRALFNYLFLENKKLKDTSDSTIINFEKLIKEINQFSRNNNSDFIFIYLPEWSRYYTFKYYKNVFYRYDEENYNKILKILNQNKIEFIDIHKVLFDKEKNPLKYFPFEIPGHYNDKGYSKIAEVIYNELNKMNIN